MRLKRVTIFKVIFIALNIIKLSSIESGIEILTRKAFLRPIENIRTAITSTRPVYMLFSRSSTIMRTSLERSIIFVIVTP